MSTQEKIARLLDLPGLIDGVGRKLVAQRADMRSLERKIRFREAEIRLDRKDEPGDAKTREAVFVVACGNDPELAKMIDRQESLKVAIDAGTHQRDVLDHERKALKAALEREYAKVIEQLLTDEQLARKVASTRALS